MGKKAWKRKAKREKRYGDELFAQVTSLSSQLQRVDHILTEAVLEGPTIDGWAAQVRIVLTALVQERGLVSGAIPQAFGIRAPVARIEVRNREIGVDGADVIAGEYTLLSDADLKPFPPEYARILEGRNP